MSLWVVKNSRLKNSLKIINNTKQRANDRKKELTSEYSSLISLIFGRAQKIPMQQFTEFNGISGFEWIIAALYLAFGALFCFRAIDSTTHKLMPWRSTDLKLTMNGSRSQALCVKVHTKRIAIETQKCDAGNLEWNSTKFADKWQSNTHGFVCARRNANFGPETDSFEELPPGISLRSQAHSNGFCSCASGVKFTAF